MCRNMSDDEFKDDTFYFGCDPLMEMIFEISERNYMKGRDFYTVMNSDMSAIHRAYDFQEKYVVKPGLNEHTRMPNTNAPNLMIFEKEFIDVFTPDSEIFPHIRPLHIARVQVPEYFTLQYTNVFGVKQYFVNRMNVLEITKLEK